MKKISYVMPEREAPIRMAAEPEVMYGTRPRIDIFSQNQFQNLSSRLLFTQQEWADILHISDRTLQRYLKDGKAFEGLYAEHLYQLENMAALGLVVFGDATSLDRWLRKPREVLGVTLDFSTLTSFWGVRQIASELGRMEHGVYL